MDDDLDTDQNTLSLNYQTSVSGNSISGAPVSEQNLAGKQDHCSKFRRDWSQGSWYSAKLASLGMAICVVKFLITYDRQPYPS